MNAKDELLGRIRGALGDTPREVPMLRAYVQTCESPLETRVHKFAERAADYRAAVHHVAEAELGRAVARVAEKAVARAGANGAKVRGVLVAPPDLPAGWLEGLTSVGLCALPDEGLSHAELAESGGVLTGCALAVADTGTIVLDGGAYQGRRAVTLLPDLHLCVVFDDQIVGTVPEAVMELSASVRAGRALTLISGPSATSDIELSRVEGVHGPRTLEILLVARTGAGTKVDTVADKAAAEVVDEVAGTENGSHNDRL